MGPPDSHHGRPQAGVRALVQLTISFHPTCLPPPPPPPSPFVSLHSTCLLPPPLHLFQQRLLPSLPPFFPGRSRAGPCVSFSEYKQV